MWFKFHNSVLSDERILCLSDLLQCSHSNAIGIYCKLMVHCMSQDDFKGDFSDKRLSSLSFIAQESQHTPEELYSALVESGIFEKGDTFSPDSHLKTGRTSHVRLAGVVKSLGSLANKMTKSKSRLRDRKGLYFDDSREYENSDAYQAPPAGLIPPNPMGEGELEAIEQELASPKKPSKLVLHGGEVLAPAKHTRPNALKSPALSAEVQEVVQHYLTYHPRSKPSPKVLKNIAERINKDGYSVQDLKDAIDGMHQNPFNLGQNDKGVKYLGLELCTRSGEKVEFYKGVVENMGVSVRKMSIVEEILSKPLPETENGESYYKKKTEAFLRGEYI